MMLKDAQEQMIKDSIATPDEFSCYLERHIAVNPQASAGRRFNAVACPIARWLRRSFPNLDFAVATHAIDYNTCGQSLHQTIGIMDTWIAQYIAYTDDISHVEYDSSEMYRVTYQGALDALKYIVAHW